MKYALQVTINKYKTMNELTFCINDLNWVKQNHLILEY